MPYKLKPLTVRELIDKLEKYPGSFEALLITSNGKPLEIDRVAQMWHDDVVIIHLKDVQLS